MIYAGRPYRRAFRCFSAAFIRPSQEHSDWTTTEIGFDLLVFCKGIGALNAQKDERTMAKKQAGRKPKGNLLKEIDAALALLTRVRALAASASAEVGTPQTKQKQIPVKAQSKRTLSADAREAIAAAQRKRWAKVRRAKKKAERAALTQ